MKRVFDSPFLNKAALVLIWLLLMGGTFFYANKNYFLYHENPNLIKADGYYLYNFGSPRHYYWALPVKFTHEDKVYHSQLPLDIRDESSSCTVDLRIYIPADSSGSAFTFRNNITIPALWRIFIFVPLLLLLTSKRKAYESFTPFSSSSFKKMGGFTYLPFSQKSFYFSFYNVSRKRMNASLPSVVHLYTPASSRTWVNTIPISF